MLPQVYLAARYSRRIELCRYREQLQAIGFKVQARWLDGKHQIDNLGKPIGDTGEALVENDGDASTDVKNAALRAKFARDDFEDVMAADIVINFTEPPRSNHSRGGRHVELGIALANRASIIVVGHRENIFHWLPGIDFAENWDQALGMMKGIA